MRRPITEQNRNMLEPFNDETKALQVVLEAINKQPHRSRGILLYILEENDYSVSKLYEIISQPNSERLKYISYKASFEIQQFAQKLKEILFSNNLTARNVSNELDLDFLRPALFHIMDGMSVRAQNAIKQFLLRHNNSVKELYDIFSSKVFKPTSLPNVGRLTGSEIYLLAQELKRLVESSTKERITNNDVEGESGLDHSKGSSSTPRPIKKDLGKLLPLLPLLLEGFSQQVKTAINSFLTEHDNSVEELYSTICRPGFNPMSLRKVGKRTAQEILDFSRRLENLINSYDNSDAFEDARKTLYLESLDRISVPQDAQVLILQLQDRLGHFPLFAAVQSFIDIFSDDEKMVINKGLPIYQGQIIQQRGEAASELGLNKETFRLKREGVFRRIEHFLLGVRKSCLINECKYDYNKDNLCNQVNEAESTGFNLNFICWAIDKVFTDVMSIGGGEELFLHLFNQNPLIYLAPSRLNPYFHFESFINDIRLRLEEKRINESRISLDGMMIIHRKKRQLEKDVYCEIKNVCTSILSSHFHLSVDNGFICLPANARKNNPIIVEEILRAAGRPLTLEELYKEFSSLYPERAIDINSFRGSVNKSPNVIPIGRSSRYTLKEWTEDEYRGGTIREIVCEYLSSRNTTIAEAEEVGKYVRRFRPTSSDKSISSNLIQDKSNKFLVLERKGIRYYALAGRDYGTSYKPIANHRSFEESLKLLEVFIRTHNRFPSSSGDSGEERRLARFTSIQRNAFSHKMPYERKKLWAQFEARVETYFAGNNPKLIFIPKEEQN